MDLRKTTILSPYAINLDFKTQMQYVHCAVGIELLTIIYVSLSL